MDEEPDEGDTFVHYSFDVSMCRLVGNLLLPTKLTLKLGIELWAEDEDEISFALTKVEHWMTNHVSRCIAVCCQNSEGFGLLLNEKNTPRLENSLMITADEPTDNHLLFIFQAKIQALADGAFEVMTIEIQSDNSHGLTFTYVGDGVGQLPDMSEWLPGTNWFNEPWWNRNDISMIDTTAPEDADLSIRPSWAATLDFLRPNENDQSAVVITGEWEPRIIIENDKED